VIVLGRGADNDIVIDHKVVSYRHAILRRLGTGYQIEDLGSANGLYFGANKIASRLLRDGDVVTIGSSVALQFHMATDGDGPESDGPPASANR
jgi:pSer/pThr/pTyr-binding forkhead associated (FHA) protein